MSGAVQNAKINENAESILDNGMQTGTIWSESKPLKKLLAGGSFGDVILNEPLQQYN